MEFYEKLQELRKSKGLTQEELAESLYVSRAAVSKWESGRGYPNIDSLKAISKIFEISIDELLSGERLIGIAENENKAAIRKITDFIFGVTDLFSLLLIFLPLYPDAVDGFIYSVSLFSYNKAQTVNLIIYWVMYLCLFVCGIVKIVLTRAEREKPKDIINAVSVFLNIFIVLLLALTRDAYAVVVAFLLLLIKGGLLFYRVRHKASD